MIHNNKQVLNYWDQDDVESMYDKNLLFAEIELIKRNLSPGTKILDAGCGEGEGSLVYSLIPDVVVHAVDFSETRLKKATERLKDQHNVKLSKVDFLGQYVLDHDYDTVISQRFLINLMEWELQKKVLLDFMQIIKPGGKLLMLEGSIQGVDELNAFRVAWNLDPIPVKWHNLFFDDTVLLTFMKENGYTLVQHAGLGSYFLLTRGIRPALDQDLSWDSPFNQRAAADITEALLQFNTKFSRLKLWVFQK
jgi:ubiquinone/menaquinone biosynthesis C-methylase UbiE